jgi:P-type conjugative transfer protein TrbG
VRLYIVALLVAAPLAAQDSAVATVIPFGRARPTLVCAPLRACAIELEGGERVLGTASGDSERWLVERSATGAGGRTPLVIVKPVACDLTTNLIVTTDRRVYDVTLAAPCRARGEYTRVVRFNYPDDLVTAVGRDSTTGDASPARLNFGYDVKADKHVLWAPAHVYDDGVHVYIRLAEVARHGVLPVLYEVGADGGRAMINYAVEGDAYVTDRVFERAVLVVGEGKKEQTAELTNKRLDPAR